MPSIDVHELFGEGLPYGVDRKHDEVPTDIVEPLGDSAAAARDHGGDTGIVEVVERVHVTVNREVDLAGLEFGDEGERFVAGGESAVARTGRIERWDMHADDVELSLA